MVGYTGPTDVPHIMSAGGGNGFPSRGRSRRRNQRGLLSQIGGMLLPGLGGTIGQIGDNLVGGLLGGRASAAPVASAGRFRSMQANKSEEHGVEQIATVTIPAGTPAGTIVLQVPLAAPAIGVRLSTFSNLWTKTLFRNLVVEVTSSNPSSVAGNYTLAIDPDPAQTYESGPDLPPRLMALTMASKANAWADNILQMIPNLKPLFNRFHLEGASDAEIREYAAGQLIMATTTDYADDCEYTVNVGWDVQFEKPDTTPTVEDIANPKLFMNVGGLAYTVAGADVITIPGGARAFNRANVGTFQVLVTDFLTIQPKNTNGTLTVGVTQITYDATADELSLFIDIVPSPGLIASTLGVQSPVPYYINVGAVRNARELTKVGYGLIHPMFLLRKRKEHEWYQAAVRRALSKKRSSDVQAVLSDLRREKLRNATEEELETLLVNLSLSRSNPSS